MSCCSESPITWHLRAAALCLCCCWVGLLTAQDRTNLRYENHTYSEALRTVRLTIDGFPHSYPVIQLGGGARLRLSFDDVSEDLQRYSYGFIHCNQDWKPSNLGQMEYNSGFATDYLEDYDFSLRTLTQYVHYDLTFPNQNMRLEKSGNYLLVVYDTRSEQPVITRRFMVSENLAGVTARVTRPNVVDKIRTHQEVQLVVNTKQLRPRAPLQEISATVLQNGRWDNAVTGVAPNLLGRENVQFNYQDVIVFAGGNEFRNLDLRSVQAPRTPVSSITNEGDFIAMMLLPEETRGNSAYVQYFDLNGDYVNFRTDRPVVNLADEFLQENFARFGLDFTGEYIEVTFLLKPRNGIPLDDQLYLFGALSEWQLKHDYRMVWNANINAYVGRVMVKQGFYNYYYVSPGRSNGVELERTEGSHEETENDYLGLIYYRPLGGRYDQLVGTTAISSNGGR